jgi:mRNA interferase RelE/StbE
MKIITTKLFEKDILRVTDKKLAIRLNQILSEIEISKSISQIKNLKKIKGYSDYFRVRLGDYRLGVKFENDGIYLLRFMHRKEIYRYFP